MTESTSYSTLRIRAISLVTAIGVVSFLLFGRSVHPWVPIAAAVAIFGIGYSHLIGALVFTKAGRASKLTTAAYRMTWSVAAFSLYSLFSGEATFFALLFLFFLHIIENDLALSASARAEHVLARPSLITLLISAALSLITTSVAFLSVGNANSWDHTWLHGAQAGRGSTLIMISLIAGATVYHSTTWLLVQSGRHTNRRRAFGVWSLHLIGTFALAAIALIPVAPTGEVSNLVLSPYSYVFFSALHAAHTTWLRMVARRAPMNSGAAPLIA